MSVGTYGIKRNATVQPEDVDIFYTYAESRTSSTDNKATKLAASTILATTLHPNELQDLPGLYELTLPKTVFNKKGIYNIMIKPKEIHCKIVDCGVLSARPDVKGIVIDINDSLIGVDRYKFTNSGLVGYRIEYIDSTTKKITSNLFRIVTSSNKCEAVMENSTNTNQKNIKYRFNDSGTLMFLTVTPSSTSTIKSTSSPFLGNAGQEIILYNTFFDPINIEVELVQHTSETLAHALYGNQTKSIVDGKYTVYTEDTNEIYKQANLYEIVDDFGNTTYEVKENTDTIDDSKDFDNIVNSVNRT